MGDTHLTFLDIYSYKFLLKIGEFSQMNKRTFKIADKSYSGFFPDGGEDES